MGILQQIITQDVYLLKLSEPLVGWRAEELEQNFERLQRLGARQVYLNLENVAFIDSRGLAALVRGLQLFGRDKNNVRLISPQTQPVLVLNLTGFDQFFSIESSDCTSESSDCTSLPIKRPQPARQRLRSKNYPVAAPV